MTTNIDINKCYSISDDVIARNIEDEIIIVPLTTGIGDLDDDLYTLNETGKAVWDLLDGSSTLKQIVDKLGEEFNATNETIKNEVIGLCQELLDKKLIIEIKS